jgi:hypothetical protein
MGLMGLHELDWELSSWKHSLKFWIFYNIFNIPFEFVIACKLCQRNNNFWIIFDKNLQIPRNMKHRKLKMKFAKQWSFQQFEFFSNPMKSHCGRSCSSQEFYFWVVIKHFYNLAYNFFLRNLLRTICTYLKSSSRFKK